MPITDFLERNARLYKDDVSLVEINPELQEKSRVTWREYSLIEQGANTPGRNEITWEDFDKRANRFANCRMRRYSDARRSCARRRLPCCRPADPAP